MPIIGWKGKRTVWCHRTGRSTSKTRCTGSTTQRSPHCSNSTWGSRRRQEERIFDRIEEGSSTDYVWAILDDAEQHIGFIGLHEINWRHRWALGGLVIGERSAWGRGYASDAVRIRTGFAFGQLGLHRIEGHTMNPAMKRVYEKCGYRHEGVARGKFWRDGRWEDADLYAILDEDWFAGLQER